MDMQVSNFSVRHEGACVVECPNRAWFASLVSEDHDILDRTAEVVLRPPRVAILFLEDEHWRTWARQAIATGIWGGGGFIFAPYDEQGHVLAGLLPVITAYDPDYIAHIQSLPSTWLTDRRLRRVTNDD
jgi:hypothetical protein